MNFRTLTSELPLARGPVENVLANVLRATSTDVMLLHSAGDAGGASVLAWDPLLTLEYADGASVCDLAKEIAASAWSSPHPLVGWLGFVSYDAGRAFEHIGNTSPDELHWPVLRWSVFRNYLVRDADGRWTAYVVYPADAPSPPAPPAFLSLFELPPDPPPMTERPHLLPHLSPAHYAAKVQRVREYIAAGDIYQANLAQCWRVKTADDPLHIFQRLMRLSPAAYSAFIRFTARDGVTRHVLSASPELFVQVDSGQVLTRPIKGTRRRDLAHPARDAALRSELLASEKDRAELAMIVDLLRNDVGRISRFGTVRVTEPRAVEQHPTVWHTVATIESQAREDVGLAEFLQAVCPGGSITGAPKIRAMQIIEELEGFRRGLYCGNIGLIAPHAATGSLPNLTLNIAIRTMLIQNGIAHVYAGGGIVADSDPRSEYDETLIKARAMLEALGVSLPVSPPL